MNISHNSKSLTASYLGPQVPIGITRKGFPFSQNLASSYIPNRLISNTRPLSEPVEKLVVKHQVTYELLTDLSNDLKNHLENRIHLFVQQMMLIYKTELSLDLYKHADIQVGCVPSTRSGDPTYVAAHSGTLPTLRLGSSPFKDASISLAQNTSIYYGWNTTVYLPEVANQVDSDLDKSVSSGPALRDTATDILNKVSLGTLCPKEGLRDFLESLIQVIASIQNSNNVSRQRTVILENYAKVAENYYDNLNNGYPLIQKLFLRPIVEKVDEHFYMKVQAEMHEQLKSELEKLQPKPITAVQLPVDLNLEPLKWLIAEKLPPIHSDTAQEYIKLCALGSTVRAAATQYLISLNQLSPSERNNDITSILRITTSKNIQSIGLSAEALSLYSAALNALQSRIKEPQNMHFIVLSILLDIGRDLIVTPPTQISPEEKIRLCNQISEWTVAANVQPTDQSQKYTVLCAKAEKVRKAAELFFNELYHSPDSFRKQNIDKMLKVQQAKIGSSGLSPNALTFYKEVLETIKNNHQVKNPRNMPIILSQLLRILNSN